MTMRATDWNFGWNLYWQRRVGTNIIDGLGCMHNLCIKLTSLGPSPSSRESTYLIWTRSPFPDLLALLRVVVSCRR